MKIEAALRIIGESETPLSTMESLWETSLATLSDGALSFLEPEVIERNLGLAGMNASELPFLVEAASLIQRCEALKMLFWHGYRRLVFHPDSGSFVDWPVLNSRLKHHAGAFYLLIALSAIPQLWKLHQRLGIPEDITRNTSKTVPFLASYCRQITSAETAARPLETLSWMRHCLAGKLFRIGRLEWMMQPFMGRVHVFRHQQGGRVIALAAGGETITPDGYLHWEGEPLAEDAWQTDVCFDNDEVSGYPVQQDGTVLRKRITLNRSDWQHRLSPKMNCLDLHIPAGGGMTAEACRDSFFEARAFFQKFFPQWQFNAFACGSWIFNPALQSILPSSANLVRLQQQVHLFPIPSAPDNGLYFVFGSPRFPDSISSSSSSLQKAIFNYIQQGNRWRAGGMFLLIEELPHFFGSETPVPGERVV